MPGEALLDWCVMIFLAENNSLESTAFQELAKLTAPQQTADNVAFHVLVETLTHGSYTCRLHGDMARCGFRMRRMEYRDACSLDTLCRFVRASMERDPARRYALFVGGHGGGYFLHLPPTCNVFVTDMARRFRRERFRFELLAFDCCLMAMLETAFELRHAARFLLATPDYESFSGLLSTDLVSAFGDPKLCTTPAIADVIIRSYMDRNNAPAVSDSSTGSSSSSTNRRTSSHIIHNNNNKTHTTTCSQSSQDSAAFYPWHQAADLTLIATDAAAELVRLLAKVPSKCVRTSRDACHWARIDPEDAHHVCHLDVYHFIKSAKRIPRDLRRRILTQFHQVVLRYEQNDYKRQHRGNHQFMHGLTFCPDRNDDRAHAKEYARLEICRRVRWMGKCMRRRKVHRAVHQPLVIHHRPSDLSSVDSIDEVPHAQQNTSTD